MLGLFVLKSSLVFFKLTCQKLCFRDSIKEWIKYMGNILPRNKAAPLPSFTFQYLLQELSVSIFFYLCTPRNRCTCTTVSNDGRNSCFLSTVEIV